jgi:hypothetical protein
MHTNAMKWCYEMMRIQKGGPDRDIQLQAPGLLRPPAVQEEIPLGNIFISIELSLKPQIKPIAWMPGHRASDKEVESSSPIRSL